MQVRNLRQVHKLSTKMYIFIFQILLMLSLGTMIYLIARAVPRVSDEAIGEIKQNAKFDRLFSFLRLEKIDPILHNFLEKLLRKIKFILMRLDNITSSYLNKVKGYKLNNNDKNGEEKQNLFDNKIETDSIEADLRGDEIASPLARNDVEADKRE